MTNLTTGKTEFYKALLFFFIPLFFSAAGWMVILGGCKTIQKPVAATKPLQERTENELIQKMNDSSFACEWLNAKISVEVVEQDKSTSFNATLRLRKDSLIWMSISPALGIEVVRVLISKDSLKMMDRINTQYAVRTYDYLNKMFRIELTFNVLQSMILGNYFPYMDEKKLKSAYVDDPYYILSTLTRHKLKRSLEEKDPNKRIIQDLWMDPNTSRITKIQVEDNRLQHLLEINYSELKPVATRLFPHKTNMKLAGRDTISMSVEYNKVVINVPQEFPFTIPAKYEKLK